MISKSNLKQAATKGDVNQLKTEIEVVEKRLNSLEDTIKITAELSELKLKTGLRKEMDIVVERATLRTLEQMRKDKMDILGAVADFGKMASSTNDAQNLFSARVEDHEGRLVKIESKVLSFPG